MNEPIMNLGRFVPLVLAAIGLYALPSHLYDRFIGRNVVAVRPYLYFEVPVATDGDRVYFFQRGRSLTVLDIETGEVLLRGEPMQPDSNSTAGKLEVVGNWLRTDGHLIDKRDGKVVAEEGRSLWAEPQVGKKYLVSASDGDGVLQAFDMESGGVRTLATIGKYGSFAVRDEDVFLVSYQGEGNPAIFQRLDLPTGEVRWSRQVPVTIYHLEFAEDTVYAVPFSVRRDLAEEKMILAFALDGTPKPDVLPGQKLYRELTEAFSASWERAGDYAKTRALARERLGHEHVFSPRLFPDGAMAGYMCLAPRKEEYAEWGPADAPDGTRRAILLFDDDDTHWERRINSVEYNQRIKKRFESREAPRDRLSSFFHLECDFALDDVCLIYSTNTGKVECIERSSGRSRWIYSYSRNSWHLWHEEFPFFRPRFSIANWWSDSRLRAGLTSPEKLGLIGKIGWALRDGRIFYDEDREVLDLDMSQELALGVSARGEEPSHPPAIFDPNPPSLDFPETDRVAFLCRVLPYATLVALWLMITRRAGLGRRALFICLILLVQAWGIYSYGRYSAATLRTMVWAMHWTYMALVVSSLRRFLPWASEPLRKSREAS